MTNIDKTPKELGLDLGPYTYFGCVDNPFINIDLPVKDLGEIYLIVCNDTQAKLIPKNKSILAISQLIAYLDLIFHIKDDLLSDLLSDCYTGFSVQNKNFTKLTLEAIELIKNGGEISLHINYLEDSAGILRLLPQSFRTSTEDPFDMFFECPHSSPYVERCILLRNKLNL